MRPNILYLHCHDAGRHLSVFGHAVSTPALAALAGEGMLFRQAHCAAPTCSPSRAALLTGRSAHATGMLGLAHRGARLTDPSTLLPARLRAAGYRTVLTGIEHLAGEGRGPADLGYDEDRRGSGSHRVRDEAAAAAAVDFLASAPADQPWFLDVGFFVPHRTDTTPEKIQWFNDEESPCGDPRHVRVPELVPDTPETRVDTADLHVALARMDALAGRVLEALARSGQAERTLVIATTDHGIAFPHHKCTLSDRGTGVFLILRGPGGFAGGRTCDALVSHLDLVPTVAELAGLSPDPVGEGSSLLPLAADPTRSIRDAVFAEITDHADHEPRRSIRTGRHRYVRNVGTEFHRVTAHVDPSPSRTWLEARGWADEPPPSEALYDLAFDPVERDNRIADPRYAAVLAELRARLDRWMVDTGDPAALGPVVRSPSYHYTPQYP